MSPENPPASDRVADHKAVQAYFGCTDCKVRAPCKAHDVPAVRAFIAQSSPLRLVSE